MKTVYRFLVLFALIVAAIASYTYSSTTGLFIFVMLGFTFEAAFWLKVFPNKKKS
ncbi:hypothetical protein PSECIP111951_02135 [Pseudoalteromonas holothuriae]|uniref:Uncharacterized protein n=1 Tax=Pseudoalteromonas holothuriae TaxID=2963714 RepID=A0A9W4VVM3_9GAMM|nr:MULTISPECIES: hypothetical protein [unclassified Pseudoalteromonas]CAH9050755.1 hypothetical protein PSECIP111854_00595 [Pseudoalteromonas sp. CIP111854]CAH9059759.1 hypothetical protein PSECIP111951_02135 [Pseudoalteromonas sp. CIP111951]